MIDPRVKKYAYTLDAECWKSYSGESKQFKQLMEARRNATLEKAAADIAVLDAADEAKERAVSRRQDGAGQWEHIARFFGLGICQMSHEEFDMIVRRERQQYIDGGER